MARDSSERLDEIFRRAERVRNRESLKSRITADAVGCGICLAALALFVLALPEWGGGGASDGMWRYGGLLLNGSAGGYILVAAVSLVLGVLVTLLVWHVRRLRQMDRERRRP